MHPIHHRPIYTKFYALSALGFLFGVVYGIFSLTLPILAENTIVSVSLLGLIFALPELFGVFMDIPIGAFANRFGRRHAIFYSGILLAASALLFILIQNPILFVFALIFYEIATQLYIIPADAELMALSPARSAGRFNGFVEGIHNMGFSLGPIFAGFILASNFTNVFLAAMVVSLLMVLGSVLYLPREETGQDFLKSSAAVWRGDKVFLSSFREFRGLGFLGMFFTFLFFIFALHWGFLALIEPIYTNALGA